MNKHNILDFLAFEESDKYRKRMMSQIGKNIRNARRKRKMSQMTASEIAGISDNFWGSIERGRQACSSVVLLKIAGALQIPVCRILGTNHCPYAKDRFLAKVRALFAERHDNERQKAMRLLEVCFLNKIKGI
jgi:transcriptional regulator with XRE-family HTH domain